VTAEEPLIGSMDPRWAPVRVGDTVRRPGGVRPAVRDLLLHLEAVGFDGAPRHLGVDEDGREIVSFIEGDVPVPPYPAWAMTDRALEDLGRLVRRFHEATASYVPAPGAEWAADWADPTAGRVRPGGPCAPDAAITHNDLFPENVVFRDGRVIALIDFAMAAPGRPMWDLAIAAEMWGPLGDPARRDRHPPDLDGIARFGALARAYGLPPERAEELVNVLVEERAHSIRNIRAEIAAGNRTWIRSWAAAGGDERAAADDAWIAAHRAAFVRAAGG
jgi:phosphotransferase family enzyme